MSGRMKEGEFDFLVSFLSLLINALKLLSSSSSSTVALKGGDDGGDDCFGLSGGRFSGSRHRGYWGHVSGGGLERDAMVDVCGA